MNKNKKEEKRCIIVDFEVLSNANFWMCCMKDYKSGKEHVIINDRDELLRVYNKNKEHIWVGYNIKGYDQWIMKAIIAGIDPCKISKSIIEDNIAPWQLGSALNRVKMYIFELSNSYRSLKELELFMGEDIRESNVSFDLMRYPTQEEIDELTTYCMHDVRMTYKVFQELYFEYEAQLGLIEYFNLDASMFNKTKAQLSAYILQAKKPNYARDDLYEFNIVDSLKLSKYSYVCDWYLDFKTKGSQYLNTEVYGVSADFGVGGLHLARKKYKANDFIVNSDVSSFYPSIMIEYDLLSRNVKNPEKFREIRDTRFKFKKEKNPIEKSLKIVLNSTFGASKDENNELYDPRQGLAICINGQLLLLDLIEKVELEFGDRATLIQGNTDGVMFKFDSQEGVDRYIEICNEWSNRTKMELEHDFISKIIQKDVNNYIFIKEDGSIKSKGAYVKKLSLLDNDLPIINKALINKMVNNIEVEDTINNATELIDFQKCIKISGKYESAIRGDEKINLKVLRIFASNKYTDLPVMKMKSARNPEKIANTPDKMFIDNTNILGKSIPEYLDRKWYIDLAKKRLEDFLPDNTFTLFDFLDSL